MKNKKTEVRVCGCNKYCYSSEASAQRALDKYSDLLRIYKCPEDNTYWHTTSQKQKNKEDIKKIKKENIRLKRIIRHKENIIQAKSLSLNTRKQEALKLNKFLKKYKIINWLYKRFKI